MYKLTDKEGNVTSNIGKVVEVAKEFYRGLYSCRHNQDDNERGSGPEEFGFPPVTTEEVKKALEAMKGGKAAGEYQVTADLFKDGGQIVLEKL